MNNPIPQHRLQLPAGDVVLTSGFVQKRLKQAGKLIDTSMEWVEGSFSI